MEAVTSHSLISRSASAGLKGVLIVLIILGHNSFLAADAATDTPNWLFRWLYSFHVVCFLILPFLYGVRPISGKSTRRNFIRLYAPYALFFVLYAVEFWVVKHQVSSATDYAYAFVNGGGIALQSSVGTAVLWFLPVMFALLVLKGIYDRGGRWVKVILLTISAGIWVAIIAGVAELNTIAQYVPLGIVQAFYYLPLGIIIKEVQSSKFKIQSYIWWILFIVLSIGYLITFNYQLSIFNSALKFLVPITAFMALTSISEWLGHSKLIRILGENSLAIYLIHPIIWSALRIGAEQLTINPIVVGAITFILTIAISLGIAIVVKRILARTRLI